ncbi:MAG TPA: hypothetical protein VKV02_10560, partial [Acidobacteriaceae bacterium]|nr:hypothetical protein [Acidobacteriaceae bacterium]
AGPFAQADLEEVSGVHLGSKLNVAQMQAAVQHLVDTGCFDDIHLDSAGTPAALTLVFVLKPVANQFLYRAAFENFVWFTPVELRAIAHRSAPLFSDRVPESGVALDAVTAGLQAALAERGVTQAEVVHEFLPATSAHPETLVVFRVAQPRVVVQAASLDGVPAEFSAALSRIEAKLKGSPYVAKDEPDSTESWLLAPLWDAGYSEARVADTRTTIEAAAKDAVGVRIEGKLEAGALYHVGTVGFEATPVVTAQTFATMQKLQTGATASRGQLLRTEAPIEAAYHKLGYMYAYVDAGATTDSATHTVNYALKVVPGDVFRLHSVNVLGLSPEARAQFDLAWMMKPGDPYNADYVSGFLTSNTAMRGLAGYVGGFQAATDAEKHEVDLTVTFARASGK